MIRMVTPVWLSAPLSLPTHTLVQVSPLHAAILTACCTYASLTGFRRHAASRAAGASKQVKECHT